MGEPSDEIEAGGRSAPLGKTRTDPKRTYHLPISAISMIILPSYVHELYEGGIREVLEKEGTFWVIREYNSLLPNLFWEKSVSARSMYRGFLC